jgi:hypothetical protein
MFRVLTERAPRPHAPATLLAPPATPFAPPATPFTPSHQAGPGAHPVPACRPQHTSWAPARTRCCSPGRCRSRRGWWGRRQPCCLQGERGGGAERAWAVTALVGPVLLVEGQPANPCTGLSRATPECCYAAPARGGAAHRKHPPRWRWRPGGRGRSPVGGMWRTGSACAARGCWGTSSRCRRPSG